MLIFWILAAGLAALAVLFVVVPLLQAGRRSDGGDAARDQDAINLNLCRQQLAELDADLAAGKLDQAQYEAARRDIERELLHDLADRKDTAGPATPSVLARLRLPSPRTTALALLIAVPASALALYAVIGNQSLIPRLELAASAGDAQRGSDGMPSLEELVARLEQRLAQHPDDGEGWMMLGRTYFATGEREKAEQALARAYELEPEDPQVILAYAESIAANDDNRLVGRPAELISEALELEPDNATARWLAGMAAFQRGQFRSAATVWRKALAQLDPQSEDAAELRGLIEQAERRAGVPAEARQLAADPDADPDGARAGDPATASGDANTGSPSGAGVKAQPDGADGVQVLVSIAPELADRHPPDSTVFVFARAAAGPPMPLAVQRTRLGELPVSIRLDDSMAMMQGMQLSDFPQIVVGARVSPSGQASPQPGDLEGQQGPVASDTRGAVDVVIDQVRP